MILGTTWEARRKWFSIGLELGIGLDSLKVIEMSNLSKSDDCLIEVIVQWLKMAKSDSVPTLAALANALRSPTVGFGEQILSSGM